MSYPLFFFFNDPSPTAIYTLSLHDALPISYACISRCCGLNDQGSHSGNNGRGLCVPGTHERRMLFDWVYGLLDRKSTRLNSSHMSISYAVFCLKKKKKTTDSNTGSVLLRQS